MYYTDAALKFQGVCNMFGSCQWLPSLMNKKIDSRNVSRESTSSSSAADTYALAIDLG